MAEISELAVIIRLLPRTKQLLLFELFSVVYSFVLSLCFWLRKFDKHFCDSKNLWQKYKIMPCSELKRSVVFWQMIHRSKQKYQTLQQSTSHSISRICCFLFFFSDNKKWNIYNSNCQKQERGKLGLEFSKKKQLERCIDETQKYLAD